MARGHSKWILSDAGEKYQEKNKNIFGGSEIMLYICGTKQNDMDKLNVKKSNYSHRMSYNEWAKEFNVGSGYVEPTKYYQGNPGPGIKPIGVANYLDETPFERFFRILFNKLMK